MYSKKISETILTAFFPVLSDFKTLQYDLSVLKSYLFFRRRRWWGFLPGFYEEWDFGQIE